jgi:hypothetical protein
MLTTRIRVLTTALLLILLSGLHGAFAQTGACCPSCDLSECVIVTQEECEDLLGFYAGDGTTCEVDCGEPLIIPDAANCTVVPADALGGLFLCPAVPSPVEGSSIVVTVNDNCNDPMGHVAVTVELLDRNPTCGPAILSGVTNSDGEVTFLLSGSGCSHQIALSGVIKANGVTMRAYPHVKSPDTDANGRVELGDLVSFANEFIGATPSECHDYDNDETTALSDLVLFASAFIAANHCP